MEAHYYIPEKLAGIALVIWEQKYDHSLKWKMLPEFNIDLIFNLGNPWTVHSRMYKERSFNPTAHFCFLSGLHTKPIYVEFPSCHMFGIRLYTSAANLLFGLPCNELKNWAIEGDILFQNKMNYIQDHICRIPDFQSRAIWLENFIYSSISGHHGYPMIKKISSILDKACQFNQKDKHVRIEDLTGYSRMHTYRLFQKWFGTSPSEALSLKRFVCALNRMHESTENLTHVGLSSGFYDQSHFIHVFRQFAEMTPKEYMKQKTDLVGQLSY